MRQALALRHLAFEDLGNLAEVLHQHGFDVSYVEAGCHDLAHLDPLSPDLLVVLGGPIGAYEDTDYPFLRDELRLLRCRLAADVPTLGICLGAQLMARALGANVYPGGGREIGWAPLQLSTAGRQSPLVHLSGEQTAVLHWHGDTFDMPHGAVHLAATPAYENQAFVWGKRGLALQFHPEVTAVRLEQWFIGHACEISATPKLSIAQLRQDTQRYASQLQVQAQKFWQAWIHESFAPGELSQGTLKHAETT